MDRERGHAERGPGEWRGHRGERSDQRGPHGRYHRGPGATAPGMMGAGGPGASFRIELGQGRSITVRCGDAEIAECMEAAAPLLDRAGERLEPRRDGPRHGGQARRGGVDVPPPAGALEENDELPPPPESLSDGAAGEAPEGGRPIETLDDGLPSENGAAQPAN